MHGIFGADKDVLAKGLKAHKTKLYEVNEKNRNNALTKTKHPFQTTSLCCKTKGA